MSSGSAAGPRLDDLGEFEVIRRVASRFRTTSAVEVGSGDDAAVVRAPDSRVVVTTDVLVAGRHFRLDWSTPYDVGRKAAAQSLSDIAAMGAVGTALVVGVVAPPHLDVDVLAAIADGLADECDVVGATVVGGDLVRGDELVISVTALGDLDARAPVLRSGARPGDAVVVAGRLGGAAAGLAALGAGWTGVPAELFAAHRRPTPPYAAGPLLAAAGATSMVDVSDGLAADLGHVLRASDVGAVVDAAALPMHPALGGRWGAAQPTGRVVDWVLGGGEDHALVATVPRASVDAAVAVLDGAGVELRAVGEVVEGSSLGWRGLPAGCAAPHGFDHFGPS